MNRFWLAPLTPLYAAAVAWRNRRIENGSEPVRRLRWPVISIGNLSTGGSGKTPLAIALARALTAKGLHVDVLSRGYGRQSRLAARVVANGSAADFGDEPLLIAREADVPVYVAAERYEAGVLAEEALSGVEGRAVHLLDDGFQHRQLHRDVDILLMDGRDWQDCLLPAGNLREPRSAANRATVIAIPADDPQLENALRDGGWRGPVWKLRRRMEVPEVQGPVAAFCGIARPEQFFRGLEAGGLRLTSRTAFRDHFRYTSASLEKLRVQARQAGATALVTTEKDLVRLGGLGAARAQSLPLLAARLTLEIENQGAAIDWLVQRVAFRLPNRPL